MECERVASYVIRHRSVRNLNTSDSISWQFLREHLLWVGEPIVNNLARPTNESPKFSTAATRAGSEPYSEGSDATTSDATSKTRSRRVSIFFGLISTAIRSSLSSSASSMIMATNPRESIPRSSSNLVERRQGCRSAQIPLNGCRNDSLDIGIVGFSHMLYTGLKRERRFRSDSRSFPTSESRTSGRFSMNNETDWCQEVRASTRQQRIKCETALKVQIVEQLLRGKSLDTVARETGRSKKQLSFWYRRFLAGGEAYLCKSRGSFRDFEIAAIESSHFSQRLRILRSAIGNLSRHSKLPGPARSLSLRRTPSVQSTMRRPSKQLGSKSSRFPNGEHGYF